MPAGPLSRIRGAAKTVLNAPPLGIARRWAYDRDFATARSHHTFRGIFDTFNAAAKTAPGQRPVGYDHNDGAAMYRDRPLYPEDYPLLFWLKTLLKADNRVFDYGGHTGGLYNLCRKMIDFPPQVDWNIYDVPAVVEEGTRQNALAGRSQPNFTHNFRDASGADLLIASGSLQYVEDSLASRLRQLDALPKRILINHLPLHDTKQFVTLQNIRTAYCPYWIFERNPFIHSLTALDYKLIDDWRNPGKSCFIPLFPDHCVKDYSGLYFSRVG